MSNPLGFFKLSFAVLQVARHQLQGFLGAFAIFDVGYDPIPLDDVSVFISERHSAVQNASDIAHPSGGKRTSFSKRLAGGNRFDPFTYLSLKIIRVNCRLPP